MGKARTGESSGDWRHVTLSLALIAAVAGTLLLGAILQNGPERAPSPEPASASVAHPEVEPPAGEPVASGPVLPFSGDADLVDRAIADERRLDASGNGYTLQFAVICDPKNVRANLESLEGQPSFYLLTMLFRDRACFRLCWGLYDTEGQALGDRDFPEALLRITATPKVISIADALP